MDIRSLFSIQVLVFIITFIVTLICGPIIIPMLKRLKFGQTVRDDGPSTHLKKTGTPLMGGFIFLVPMVIVGGFCSIYYPKILPMILATLGFGTIGFLDDYIKVVKKRKDGLYVKQKTIGLLLIATTFTIYLVYGTNLGVEIKIPFTQLIINSVWIFIPFTIAYLYFISNSVNLTDGLDGLLAGITLIFMVFFTVVAMNRAEWDYIKVFTSIIAAGCLGFLSFNLHPAKVFMGDTGSLALGGAVCTVTIMTKLPLLILVVGAIYVVEALSVIIQVSSFKMRGKRVFKMAPIHHHFELKGWKETKVVYVFWSVTLVLCFIGLFVWKSF